MNLLQMNPDDFLDALSEVSVAAQPTIGSADLVRFDGNSGVWSMGLERVPVEDGERFVLDPLSMARGFRRWYMTDSGKRLPLDMTEPLLAVSAGKIGKNPRSIGMSDLPENPPSGAWAPPMNPGDQDWSPLVVFSGVYPHGGTWAFSHTSGGARAAFDRLVLDLRAHWQTGGAPYPVVELTVDSYKHKKYARMVHNPLVRIVGGSDSLEVTEAVVAEFEEEEDAPPPPPPPPPQIAAPRSKVRKLR